MVVPEADPALVDTGWARSRASKGGGAGKELDTLLHVLSALPSGDGTHLSLMLTGLWDNTFEPCCFVFEFYSLGDDDS